MMSGALRWMALLSGDRDKEEHRRDRSEDRYRDGDRRRKPYDERGGYQMRERHGREDEWEPKRLTKADAESWVRRMKNADGSTGEHWDYGQTEQVRQQKGYKCDPVAFYATMNMMYSAIARSRGTRDATRSIFTPGWPRRFWTTRTRHRTRSSGIWSISRRRDHRAGAMRSLLFFVLQKNRKKS